jgi:hypothetical protein
MSTILDQQLGALLMSAQRVNEEKSGMVTDVLEMVGAYLRAEERNAQELRSRLVALGRPPQPQPMPQQQQMPYNPPPQGALREAMNRASGYQ